MNKFNNPTCRCGCGQLTKFLDRKRGYRQWIHGHNGRLEKTGRKKEILEKRTQSLRGKKPWNKLARDRTQFEEVDVPVDVGEIRSQITQFINSLNYKTATNVIGIVGADIVLDIYVPERKLAIEVGTLNEKSEKCGYTKKVAQKKLIRCAEIGIKVIQIFEDEWIKKRKIVEGILKKAVGISDIINAEWCEIVELSTKEAKQFIKHNSLVPFRGGSKTLSLKFNDTTVFIATIKSWASRTEISAVCESLIYDVLDGFNVLLRHLMANGSTKIRWIVDQRLPSTAISEQRYETRTIDKFWWTDGQVRKCNSWMRRNPQARVSFFKLWSYKEKTYDSSLINCL